MGLALPDLSPFGTCTLDDGGCATCGDVAVPVRVVALRADGFTECEDRTGTRAEIATAFIPDVAPGDVLLVHMGVAIACVQRSA